MAYNKPPFTKIPFKFTQTGYSPPDFSNVHFSFGAPNTSDLKASLQVFGIYKTFTYTYLKSCPTITISYPGSIQIIKLPCIYGGIRDIGGYIYANPFNVDLKASIYALINFIDLNAYLRSTIQAYYNLGAAVTTIPPINLYGILHGFAIKDLSGLLSGFAISDILADIKIHLPTDLSAYLNIIEIRDLISSINGEWWHGQFDLYGNIYKIWQRGVFNLIGKLHSYDTFDLVGMIASVYKYDLSAIIQSTSVATLKALLYTVIPEDLNAKIHGFIIRGLPAVIIGDYGPGHLHAYIYAITYKDLVATIHGYKGLNVPFDLRAIISGLYISTLGAQIFGINSVNLQAILISKGQSIDLVAKIIPKVVHLKKVLLVSLLEHSDLNAVINYSCFASSFNDLEVYLYTIYKKDLHAFIFPWRANDGYLDLGAFINSTLYQVEDKLIIKSTAQPRKFTVDRIVVKPKHDYYVFNTIDVLFGTYYFKDLIANIIGTLRFNDLPARIKAIIPRNYSELPEYIKPKSHEVVIKFDGKGHEKWRRFVELMFRKDGAEPYHYFYVSGENKVYKIDKNRHWTIWAYSYVSDKTDMIERKAVRTKFIFNINKYNSIDEAVRDLIDRVSAYRECDLYASINPYIDKISYLKANIIPCGNIKRKWSSYLKASIVGN